MGNSNASHHAPGIDGRRRVKQPYEIAFAQREALEARRKDWKRVILREYAACGNVTKACKAANIPAQLLYKARREDSEFAEAWAIAHRAATDKVLEAVWEMGVEGTREPIIWQGEIIAYVRRKDLKAAKFLLEAYDPATYSQRERIARMGMMQADQLAQRRDQMLTAAEERIRKFMSPGTTAELPETIDATIIDSDPNPDSDSDSDSEDED